MPPQITLKPETPEDEAFLHVLYASSRDEEMKQAPWPEEQKRAFLLQQSQAQLSHYRQHYADASFQIIMLNGAPAGRLYVHRGANEIRLMDITLLREFRGQGVGSTLSRELLAEGATSGKKVTLHVEQFNPAFHLYERMGFRVVEDKGIYLYMEWTPATA